MADISGRKYQVTLDDGRVVSRQRAHQIAHKEDYDDIRKRYRQSEKGRAKMAETTRRWNERFVEEHGMTYAKWRTLHKKGKSNGETQEQSPPMDS